MADLKRSAYVAAIQRFSDPPAPADVVGLTLEEDASTPSVRASLVIAR